MMCDTTNIAYNCLNVDSKPARDECDLKHAFFLVSAALGGLPALCEGSVFQRKTIPM